MMVNHTQFNALKEKISKKDFTMAVIGLGYVGLPLACEFIHNGIRVIGCDISEQKVDALKNGTSYIQDISNDAIQTCMATDRFTPTTDFSLLSTADVISICVPTPLRKTKDPDMSYVVSAINQLMPHIRDGQLIILESTTYPGTTEEMLQPKIEATNRTIGETIFLAFSPERVDPGNPHFNTKNTPKVVGGVTPQCTTLTCMTYDHCISKTVPVSSPRTAELVKLYENTFRSVNIAMANEMAIMANKLGIDVWEMIAAAETKPFGFMPFYPGPGLGGHCIPIDPSYLSWKMKSYNYSARFIGLAEQINTSMPTYVIQKIGHALNSTKKAINGASILILGVAYKPNINDARESPAIDIMHELLTLGATVHYNDAFIPTIMVNDQPFQSTSIDTTPISHYDCVVIVTNHDYYTIDDIVTNSQLVVDTRNATKGLSNNTVFKL